MRINGNGIVFRKQIAVFATAALGGLTYASLTKPRTQNGLVRLRRVMLACVDGVSGVVEPGLYAITAPMNPGAARGLAHDPLKYQPPQCVLGQPASPTFYEAQVSKLAEIGVFNLANNPREVKTLDFTRELDQAPGMPPLTDFGYAIEFYNRTALMGTAEFDMVWEWEEFR